MLTNQTIDPNQDGDQKPFLLFRPFIAAWQWMVPPTQAHADRQSATARWVARVSIIVVAVGLMLLAFFYARPLHNGYQSWQADQWVAESRAYADDGQYVNAITLAQKAVQIAPENISAIRLNTEFLTAMKRPEALYFLDQLDRNGATTLKDRQTRVRALLNLNRGNEASTLLQEILDDAPADATSMMLAGEVWGEAQRNDRLLGALKNYSEKHPEDAEHSLRLARVQTGSTDRTEVSEGLRRAWEIARGQDELALQALEFLDGFETLPPDEASELVHRLRDHPKSDGRHFAAALKRQIKLEPSRRSTLIQETIERAQGKSREELLPLVRWLVEQKEPLQVLALVTEDEAKSYQPILENYLTALTMLKRFPDLERLVNDPKVSAILDQTIVAFYRAHLAFVMQKPVDEVRAALTLAKNAAEIERRGDISIKLADYAEVRGHLDIAQQAFKAASQSPRTERSGFQGLIRTAELNGDTETMLGAASQAVHQWPDDPIFVERFLYANLLTGRQIELSLHEALHLVEQRPEDPVRRLLAALAHWRLQDMQGATKLIQSINVTSLSAGQMAVLAGIARDSGANNAEEAAQSLIRTINPKASMLPEERQSLAKASR